MKRNLFPKHIIPRSLLGRSVVILMVPILVILAVVIGIFVDRIYREATVLHTTDAARQINYIISDLDQSNKANRRAQILARATPLDIEVLFDPEPITKDTRRYYDFSGRFIIDSFKTALRVPSRVDLKSNELKPKVYIDLSGDPITISLDRDRLSAVNPHQLLIWTALSTILISGLAYIFLRNQLKPISALSTAAEAFGRGQKKDFAPRGAAELRQAGLAFMSMRNRIERHLEQRKNMLSGVSHDLRTPLTRMKLSLSLLGDEKQADALNADISEMEAIIAEFLTFSEGVGQEDTREIDCVRLVKSIARNRSRADQKIDLKIGPAARVDLSFKGRESAIKRAIDNLLNNAFRYAGTVRLSLSLNETHIQFTIEDNGPGIPKAQRDEASKAFVRLDAARTMGKNVGSGLGLAIATDIARSHGGSLSLAHSRALGGLKADIKIPRTHFGEAVVGPEGLEPPTKAL